MIAFLAELKFAEALMKSFARTVLLILCAELLAYQGKVTAQSAVTPQAREVTAQSAVARCAKDNRNNPSEVDRKVAVFDLLGVDSALVAKDLRLKSADLGFREDCGPDKGKCSEGSKCCQVGSSGWCCPNNKSCDYDNPGDCK